MRFWNNLTVEKRSRGITYILFMVLGLTPLSPAYSQNTTFSPQHPQGHRNTDISMTLEQQLVELRGNMARLEAALEQDHRGSVPLVNAQIQGCGEGGCEPQSPELTPGTTGTRVLARMTKMEKGKKARMGQMGMGSSQGMQRMEMKKMGMMGNMGRRKGQMSGSALPGFPGASHLYHIGSTDFFLDHGEHIDLTQQQQMALNQIKEQALLSQATFDRQAEQAEQELWVLTSSDQPEIQRIEAKIRQIEKLQGDQRLAFIRNVGGAAKVLTSQQRQMLVGTMPLQQKAEPAE